MNWINIHTSTLRAPEYIGSEPVTRATWLNVLAYACEQEDGGRIAGAAHWKDRQWQQACGVTHAEVHAAAPLLTIQGDDLIVWHYPLEKEAEVGAKRNAGKHGGKASGKSRREAQLEAKTKQNEAQLEAVGEAVLERKGMEGKENGREGKESAIPELDVFCDFYHEQIPDLGYPVPRDEWLMKYHGWHASNDWQKKPPANWQKMLGSLIADYRSRHAEIASKSNGSTSPSARPINDF